MKTVMIIICILLAINYVCTKEAVHNCKSKGYSLTLCQDILDA